MDQRDDLLEDLASISPAVRHVAVCPIGDDVDGARVTIIPEPSDDDAQRIMATLRLLAPRFEELRRDPEQPRSISDGGTTVLVMAMRNGLVAVDSGIGADTAALAGSVVEVLRRHGAGAQPG